MGLGGLHIWHLLILLVIVVLVFGTKKLKTIGGDLGGALKSFRRAMENEDDKKDDARRIEGEKPDAEFNEQKDKNTRV